MRFLWFGFFGLFLFGGGCFSLFVCLVLGCFVCLFFNTGSDFFQFFLHSVSMQSTRFQCVFQEGVENKCS